MIKIFEIVNGVVIPTEHCYINKSLKNVIDNYPDDYIKIFAYLFYMYCPNDDINPFFNIESYQKEDLIMKQLDANFCTDDKIIFEAKEFVKELYITPIARTFDYIRNMIDNLGCYIKDVSLRDGKDGNIKDLLAAAEKFNKLRKEYDEIYKEMKEEQGRARGGKHISYDQRRR